MKKKTIVFMGVYSIGYFWNGERCSSDIKGLYPAQLFWDALKANGITVMGTRP